MLEYFRSLVEEENGELDTLDQKVVESELDSFGVTMVLMEIESEYPWMPDGSMSTIDIENITWAEIEEKINGNK